MMFRLLIVACLAISALAANRAGCGERPLASQNRIVNGKEAVPGDWGWQVSLTQYGRHFCGGVLINEQWVLTAAHCFQQMPRELTVDLGLHNRNAKESWTVSRKSAKVINHPQFDINRMRNDITMIKLSAPVTIDDKYIIEACLPEADMDVQSKTGWVTGWGAEYFRGQPAIKLMEVAMPILTNDRCKARYGYMVDTASTVCAGEFTVNNGACQGDSGGPFVHQHTDGKWYIVGLTSWGQNGCGYGTIYTRVSYYLDWIAQQIAAN